MPCIQPGRRFNALLFLTALTSLSFVLYSSRVQQHFGRYTVKQQDTSELQVAWLLSFGGSGTSFTIHNIERGTNTTTASNYAADFKVLVPVRPELEETGPFVHYPYKRAWPSHYIGTKTHCGGYCIDCGPKTYLHTVDSFDVACRTGEYTHDNKKIKVVYSASVPKRAVHLIRSPFDNLMGRMHLSIRRKENNRPDSSLGAIADTTVGVNQWCKHIQQNWKSEDDSMSGDFQLARQLYGHSVTCFSEWYRYIQWHNLAYKVTREKHDIPVHYVHYEDYENYVDTTSELYNFLHLTRLDNAVDYPFKSHAYEGIFPASTVKTVKNMFQDLLEPAVWELVRRYFEDPKYTPKYNASAVANNKYTSSELSKALESKSGPYVAWLISFPNSGTSYTITNTESVTMAATASNYAADFKELIPVHEEVPEGPFVHHPDRRPVPSTYILTKTHCGGFCNDCAPKSYAFDVDAFDKQCRTGHISTNTKKKEYVTYPQGFVKKVLHLIRDPFDNIIARLHLAVKKQLRTDNYNTKLLDLFSQRNRTGYLAWCNHLDRTEVVRMLKSDLISQDVKTFLRSNRLPCASEWYRYVNWHNLAIQMTERDRNMIVQYLHYESYSTDYQKTVASILEFLELPWKGKELPFIPGKTYHSYYTVEEAETARKFSQLVATTDTWNKIKHYFDWVKEEAAE